MNRSRRPVPVRALAVVGTLAGLGLCGASVAAEAGAGGATPRSVIQPAIQPARGGACVADPAFMRRNHMDLLRHQRNETVHRGVREARASLKGCIECHASAETGSVAVARTDFCVSCHSYAAVKVDCFECHSSKPPASAFLPLTHPGTTTRGATQLAARWRELLMNPGAERP